MFCFSELIPDREFWLQFPRMRNKGDDGLGGPGSWLAYLISSRLCVFLCVGCCGGITWSWLRPRREAGKAPSGVLLREDASAPWTVFTDRFWRRNSGHRTSTEWEARGRAPPGGSSVWTKAGGWRREGRTDEASEQRPQDNLKPVQS